MTNKPNIKGCIKRIEELEGVMERCQNGLEWRKDNPLAGWDESDGEMLLEVNQTLSTNEDKGKDDE
jgi:hypothetical protein